MKNLLLSIEITIIIYGLIFFYLEYFINSNWIPNWKRDYTLTGVEMSIINHRSQDVDGFILYDFYRNGIHNFRCRVVNKQGMIRIIDLLPVEINVKDYFVSDEKIYIDFSSANSYQTGGKFNPFLSVLDLIATKQKSKVYKCELTLIFNCPESYEIQSLENLDYTKGKIKIVKDEH